MNMKIIYEAKQIVLKENNVSVCVSAAAILV